MFDAIIAYSVRNKLVIGVFVLALIAWGIFSLRQIPIDAVPDITNNQVQVITTSPTLATQEVEQFITTPVELALQNLQDLVEIRSISRFGLSVVTVVFEEDTDIYLGRQLVSEHLREAEADIPPGLGTPEMAPISTGLGEIYQYVLAVAPGYEDRYSAMELRTMQDWIVSRQLSGIEGVVEVNTMGGSLKQYEVAVDPDQLKAMGVTIPEVFAALENSNENTGGAYIEKNPRTYYIRTNGIAGSLEDIRNIVVAVRAGRPILVNDVATVGFGSAPRYGALVRNGEEAVGGRVMMLRGANSAAVTERVRERVKQVQKSLPEGVTIEPYLVRDKLVSSAMRTVATNLIEGGLIVVFILVLLLGNWRAGLIVASVIPLAMLFAISMMNVLGISANLMSLGAIDFGLIVDGAVIIVEAIVHRLHGSRQTQAGTRLTQGEMDREVTTASVKIRSSAAFGEIIILLVYLPILALVGIEGKMFRPMAQTVMLAIAGALILSLTYVPAMSALFLSKRITVKRTVADRIIGFFQRLYAPVLRMALRFRVATVAVILALFLISVWQFTRLGGEFIPTLEEGDLAMQQILPPGTSLAQSIELTKRVQQRILEEIPEVTEVVTAIGSAEIPTDPMPVETGDYTFVMAPRAEWVTAPDRQAMFEAIEEVLAIFPGVGLEFSQPIQLRFNELMTGAKADIAIKLYGPDVDLAYRKAREAESIIAGLPGTGTVTVEQTTGMPQIVVDFDYPKLAQYGLQVRDVNRIIAAAFAGATAGTVYENERRFDLTVRLREANRSGIDDVANLYIPLPGGGQVPLRELARVQLVDAPMQISRENTNRRTVIGVNVGDTDVETLVEDIQQALDEQLDLPAGYYLTYGGQFENLQAASARLAVAVPVALALIFVLLYFTFGSFSQATLIFVAIPLAAIGGVWALELRGMPFSISAGIGFIALFGVAVLNGIVLVGYFNQLKAEGWQDIRGRIVEGTRVRLRPVIMTAAVASLGFLPMALSNSGGAEVQRPLATVVIGGLVTATFLTLVILPIGYYWLERWQERRMSRKQLLVLLPLLLCSLGAGAQEQRVSVDEAIRLAEANNPGLEAADRLTARNQALTDLPYAPGTTDLSYNGDGLFRENNQRVNQLSVLQRFDHPGAIRAANAVQDAVVAGNVAARELTLSELRLSIRSLYGRLQYHEALHLHYLDLLDTYVAYYRIAASRANAGAASRLDVLRIEAERDAVRQLDDANRITLQGLQRQLTLLTETDGLLPSDSLRLLTTDPAAELAPELNPTVALARERVAQSRAAIGVTAAETLPTFRLGYSGQQFTQSGYLSGLEAGVALQLFTGPNRRRVEARRVDVEVAEAQLENTRLTYSREVADLTSELQRTADNVAFFRERREGVIAELLRVTRLNYQAGQLGYLEVLDALRSLADTRQSLLTETLTHNLAVYRLQYLRNE
ncbi:cobalt-zinc-cadmium resistance protein CzcA [Neolewinella xylanilytica]|uniref:Cobalt-zinc-cadmium resistance protein CzcA n=1 Tax=Neolewinella xylanilytica TaxID=1514080 RepID=A0A2S6I2F0_9BACT|nr:CusA/CzcA family heavy metal efflux RND transporter [Neolewinella xylanilytica]PPK85333.1 cobalt-zinc-cadmium resistance protein CzcA [Neolewinella xylanilytica]